MTYEELVQTVFKTTLLPWEHDYYESVFIVPKNQQEFLDYAYEKIENLNGIWYEISGSTIYFIVKKGTVIPEDFADVVKPITDVPEEPQNEGTE